MKQFSKSNPTEAPARNMSSSSTDGPHPPAAAEQPPPSLESQDISSVSVVRQKTPGGMINKMAKIAGIQTPKGDPQAMAEE